MTLVFMDTETTGLEPDADVWEFAAIRREDDGSEHPFHFFIGHSRDKALRLPEPFLSDYLKRYNHDWALSPKTAGENIINIFKGAHVVGAVPNFDTERLLKYVGVAPWHYHLIDVENLAVGYLAAKGIVVPLPWDSDVLSRSVGVVPPTKDRHTALGDVRWARAVYDAVMSGADSKSNDEDRKEGFQDGNV